MRVLAAVLALAWAAAPARAEVAYVEPPHRPAHDFWREAIEPHAEEIQALVDRAKNAVEMVDRTRGAELDAQSLANRDRLFHELVGLLVYTRKLSPKNQDVLEQLGAAADEAGQPRLALDALHEGFRLSPKPTLAARMAGIYLRRGELDDAIYWSRTAVAAAGLGLDRGDVPPQIYLATAQSLRGDTASAIDTLSHMANLDRSEITMLALAVAYDRDEQRAAALQAMDHLKSTIGENWGEQVQEDIARFRFAPAEDVHYYRALFAEAIEATTEARAEWLIYAGMGGAFRARALAHVAELDAKPKKVKVEDPGAILNAPNGIHPVPLRHRAIP